MLEYKSNLYTLLLSILSDPSPELQLCAVHCVLMFYMTKEFLTLDEQRCIVQHYVRILHETTVPDIK